MAQLADVEAASASSDIAIVGMAGRFPGARDIDAYWELIRSGDSGTTHRTEEQLLASGVSAELVSHEDYVRVAGMLEDVEAFDAAFFDIGPRDAALMDPQHRHFLECCWEALEDAGHPPSKFDGSIGVYAGSGMNGYLIHNLLTNPELTDSLGMFVVRHTSNDKDFLSTGVSYRLNLRGPSVNVQTACSTSLVAIHLAAQSLLANECDMALAGGVTIEVPHGTGYLYRDGEILSKDGVCRAFDAQSSGTILTSGAGVVVLRRLEDALRDRDHIHAVIKATAVNNDGAGKVGYLAPSVEGHAAVVIEAQELAGVEPESIQYVEAHGTGTPVGDPIEVAALSQAFRRSSTATGFVRLGSAKPTVGHLDTAAGVASVIKTPLALEKRTLPPMAGHTAPNPLLEIERTPFTLSARATPWPRGSQPRRAGVSSLGVGGTNAHAVLEEAPARNPQPDNGHRRLITLSARSAEALDRARQRLADHLQESDQPLRDVTWTLQEGRDELPFRFAAPAANRDDAVAALRQPVQATMAATVPPSIVFMFPGGGSQYPNMGRELYDAEPAYHAAVEECFSLMEPALASAVRELLFPKKGFEDAAAEQFALPSLQLPAIFLTEYALARLWNSWGIAPAAMTGHSLGEYAAACIAGVLELKDALAVVALRGRIMERVPDAAMISINLPEPEVASMLQGGLSLAAVNAPQLCVVSGENRTIEQLEVRLSTTDVANRRVKIIGAVHCHLLDPYLEEFRTFMSRVRLNPPRIPYISNVTGTWIDPTDACSPSYWVRHLRETVRFNDGLETLLADPNRILIEVGPGTTLAALARQQSKRPTAVVSSLPHAKDALSDGNFALQALGNVWKAGARVDWKRLYPDEAPQRISLPTYPFERERHWIAPGKSRATANPAEVRPVAEWLVASAWTRTSLLPSAGTTGGRWLIFLDDTGVGTEALRLLKQNGEDVTVATLGGPESPFIRMSEREFMVNPSAPDGYVQLFEQLAELDRLPDRIVHFGGVPHHSTTCLKRDDAFKLNTDRGYFSAFEMLKALGTTAPGHSVHTTFVTSGAASVDQGDRPVPEQAMIGALARVACRESDSLIVTVVDVPFRESQRWRRDRKPNIALTSVAEQIVAHSGGTVTGTIALRGENRWIESLTSVTAPPTLNGFKPDGGYLVIGGTGGIGSELVRSLTELGASVGVIARDEHSARSLENDLAASRGSIIFQSADVTDQRALGDAIAAVRRRLGRIDGLFYLAGRLDDAPIAMKERTDLERVLAPKVQGLFALERSIDLKALDFAVLFSSVSARIAPAGQADYAAANAFVSAFAEHRRAVGDKRTIALEWSMWKQLGMVAEQEPDLARLPTIPPGDIVRQADGETVRQFVLSPENCWLLDEHRTAAGLPVLPGSAHVELLRMAASADASEAANLSRVEFVQALVCEVPTAIRLTTRRAGPRWDIRLSSFQAGGGWLEHSRCAADTSTPIVGDATTTTSVPFQASRATPAGSSVDQSGLQFGCRWRNIRQIGFDGPRGTALLELAPEYLRDLESFALHPSLLDMATSFALELVPHGAAGAYVPASYDGVVVHAPLPARFISDAVLRSAASDGNSATFDVILRSEAGTPLVECHGVTFRLLQDLAAMSSTTGPAVSRPRTRLGTLGQRCGVTPETGFTAIQLALASSGSNFVVSPVDLAALDAAARADADGATIGVQVSRPQLKTDFEAPRDEVEAAVARIWSELLGLASVGVNDDFFDLGGHSLIALRAISRLSKAFSLEIPLSTFLERPTVAAFAAFLRETAQGISDEVSVGKEARAPESARALVPIRAIGKLTPFFCVHGMYGNVLIFRELAHAMSPDRPVYGVQQIGLDGRTRPHDSIEEMATAYVSEIRALQPSGPYHIGGYSGGGIIAFEMARQLREIGQEVATLVMLDTPGPSLVQWGPAARVRRSLYRIRHGGPVFLGARAYCAMRDSLWRLRHRGSQSLEVNGETLAFHLGDRMVSAQRKYFFQPVDAPLTLITATKRDPREGAVPPDLGWSRFTRSVEIRPVCSHHNEMCVGASGRQIGGMIESRISAYECSR